MSLDVHRNERECVHHESFEHDRVVFELIRAAQERQRGEQLSRRPCLAILPGGLDGVSGGYGIAMLEQLQLSHGFFAILGSSTGAAAAAYGACKKANIGCTIYPEECTQKRFFDLSRRKRNEPIMDVHWLVHTVFEGKLRGSEHKKLNTSAVINSPVHPYFQIKNTATGITELRLPKSEEELMQVLEASMSFPALTNNTPVRVGDEWYEDAGDTNPFPFNAFADIVQPTSMLVFMNKSKKYPLSDVLKSQLQALKDSGIPYIIIWADEIDKVKKSPANLKAAGEHFADHIASIFLNRHR